MQNVIRVVVAEPPDTQDVPNVSKLPTSDDFGVGALVKVEGVLYRRCAAELGEKRAKGLRGLFGKKTPEDLRWDERPPGEWTQVTSGFNIEGTGPAFDRLLPADREDRTMYWTGYASLERARRDAAIWVRKFDCAYVEDV